MANLNGWEVQAGRGRANCNGWSLTAEAMTWQSLTDELRKTDRKTAQTGLKPPPMAVLRYRTMDQTPQPRDTGLHVAGRRKPDEERGWYILPRIEESRSPATTVTTLLPLISPEQLLDNLEGPLEALPLSRWELDEDAETAVSHGMGLTVQVRRLPYSRWLLEDFEKAALDREPPSNWRFEADYAIKADPVRAAAIHYAVDITDDGVLAASTLVDQETAQAWSLRSFTLLYRAVDLVASAEATQEERPPPSFP